MTEVFDTILTMVETLILALPRFEIYTNLFSSSDRFKSVLSLVYKDIIEFCLKATRLLKESGITRYFVKALMAAKFAEHFSL